MIKRFITFYRVILNNKNHERLVWSGLKKIKILDKCNFGVFENDRYIETSFMISEESTAVFRYFLNRGHINFSASIVKDYNPEFASNIFILASHFNNILNDGIVVVFPHQHRVEFVMKLNFITDLIYPDEKNNIALTHFIATKDIFWAFEKLILDNEEPSIIIAELLKEESKRSKQKE